MNAHARRLTTETPIEALIRRALAAEAARIDTHISRTAAPEAPGTAATAATTRRTTAMHTLSSETTPRGRQMIAALALAHLLEQDLPVLSWSIRTPNRRPLAMVGEVTTSDADLARTIVAPWRRFLRGDILTRHHEGERTAETLHWITGVYRDVPVNIGVRVLRELDGAA